MQKILKTSSLCEYLNVLQLEYKVEPEYIGKVVVAAIADRQVSSTLSDISYQLDRREKSDLLEYIRGRVREIWVDVRLGTFNDLDQFRFVPYTKKGKDTLDEAVTLLWSAREDTEFRSNEFFTRIAEATADAATFYDKTSDRLSADIWRLYDLMREMMIFKAYEAQEKQNPSSQLEMPLDAD